MAKDEKNKKNERNERNKKSKEPKKSFLKESKVELKKVIWPKPKRLANDTATVISIVLIVAIIVFLLDLIFLTLDEQLIIKSEEKIKNSTNNSIVVDDTENTELENENIDAEMTDETTENQEDINNENTENPEDVSNEGNVEEVEAVENDTTAENIE